MLKMLVTAAGPNWVGGFRVFIAGMSNPKNYRDGEKVLGPLVMRNAIVAWGGSRHVA